MGGLLSKVTNTFKKKPEQKKRKQVKSKSFVQRSQERFLASDYFAEPIQLNFKGMKRFNSFAGASISMIVRVSILIFSITRILSIISRNSDNIYSTVAAMPPDQVVSFNDYDDYQFMIGFNRVFLPETGSIEVTVDRYQND